MALMLQQRTLANGARPGAHSTRRILPQRPRQLHMCTCLDSEAGARHQSLAPGVTAEVEKTSWTSRKLFISISIQAPTQIVWECLTDYAGLGNFIPSLAENECLERRVDGAVLRQVGAQEVAMGVNFKAACTLDCTEYPQGVPIELCSVGGSGKDQLLPYPRNSQNGVPSMDITFRLLEGDFQEFRGIWRMQPDMSGTVLPNQPDVPGTLLCYSLFVRPKAWLPVGLIQDRIQKEVSKNLEAVRRRAEDVHQQHVGHLSPVVAEALQEVQGM